MLRALAAAALLLASLAGCEGRPETTPPQSATPGVTAVVPGQGHWLIGTWRGNRIGLRIMGERSRTLSVTSVDSAAGTAIGRWGNQDVQITINRNEIRFFTNGSNPVHLYYTAPAILEGTIGIGGIGLRGTPPQTIVMQRRS